MAQHINEIHYNHIQWDILDGIQFGKKLLAGLRIVEFRIGEFVFPAIALQLSGNEFLFMIVEPFVFILLYPKVS